MRQSDVQRTLGCRSGEQRGDQHAIGDPQQRDIAAQPRKGDRAHRAQEIGERDRSNHQQVGLKQAVATHEPMLETAG